MAKNTNIETAVDEAVETVDTVVEVVKVIKDEGGNFHTVIGEKVGPVCKIIEDGRTIVLGKNPANRQYCAVAKANVGIEADGYFVITPRTTEPRVLGSMGPKLPNEKLISYLPEAEQEEYRAIIARAIAARDAEKNRPLTDREKAEKALEAAKAKLAKLEAELAALNSITEA